MEDDFEDDLELGDLPDNSQFEDDDDEPVLEKAPEGEEAEKWILANKARFKKRYGKSWRKILYAKAWKLFGKEESADAAVMVMEIDWLP